jgi:pimeloyl-[acyl-carrier protein] methyl ester esterase
MRTLCLSGWGQPHDALASIASEATHFAYAHHDTVHHALVAIANAAQTHEVIIGWSLGGQLAVRAIAAGMMRPSRLVLIAVPFQFVETPQYRLGMKRDAYEKFRGNYISNPMRTLDKAWELITKDDERADDIRDHLNRHDKEKVLAADWLHWLDMLDGFSCQDLHFGDFPPTLLVHGAHDVVVEARQAKRFAEALPQAKLAVWKDCGHAPHWHDTEKLKQLIRTHV